MTLLTVLAVACTRSPKRDSQIGRSTQDGSEKLEPASRTIPDPTVETPLGSDAEQNAPPVSRPEALDTSGTPSTPSGDAGVERRPDVVYVPTPQPVVDKMLELAQVGKDDLVYDLGCGDGRIVVTAAKRYGARAVGFDIDPARIADARMNIQKNNVQDLVTVELKDLFTVDLSPATVVTLYLLPELNNRLVPQLEKLAQGSRVVTHDYDIDGVIPVRALDMKPAGEDQEHSVYFYTMPFKRAGGLALPPMPVGAPGPRGGR